MTKKQKGFTLIEIMVAVSITGLLGAIAIPLYQTYMIKAQVAEGITLSASAKEAVGDYYVNYGAWPVTNAQAGLADKAEIIGKYTEGVKIENNTIEIKYGYDAHGAIIGEKVIFTAVDDQGSITWTCASAGVIQAKHLPANCH